MFGKKYKQAMDKISISENSLITSINNATTKPKSINALKLALIACLSTAIICTSVFAALKISQQGNVPDLPDNFDELQNGSDSTSDISDTDNSSFDPSDENSDDEISNNTEYPSDGSIIDATNDASQDSSDNTTDEAPDDSSNVPAEPDDPPTESDDVPDPPEDPSYSEEPIDVVLPSLSEQGFKYAKDQEEIYDHLYNILPPELDGDPPSEPEDTTDDTTHYGDTIVTGKESIFILKPEDKKVVIISAKNGIIKQESEIQIATTIDLRFLLLSNNTLAIVGSSKNETVCYYYDVSNKDNPINIGSTSQSGKLISCMSKNGKVYFITNTPDMKKNKGESNKQIPLINKINVDYQNVVILDDNQNSFIVITAYDIKERQITSDLTILGFEGQVYCSNNYIYIAYTVVNSTEPAPNLESATASKGTKILKISLSKNGLVPIAAAYVDGIIYNNLSMSESESVFRIITTTEYLFMRETNGVQQTKHKSFKQVYCLNKDMHVIGISETFAADSHTTDMGFIGDAAYVHTYNKPSYFINVSNPYAPSAVIKLDLCKPKMYRYLYGNSHLLVVTDNSNDEPNRIEFSLIDAESQNLDVYDYSWESGEFVDENATFDNENLMIDEQYGIIGIPFSSSSYEKYTNGWTNKTQFRFFIFANGTMTPVGSVDFTLNYYNNTTRTVRVDNFLYLITEHDIFSVSAEDFSIASNIGY